LASGLQASESGGQTWTSDHRALASDLQVLESGGQTLASDHRALASDLQALESGGQTWTSDHRALASITQALRIGGQALPVSGPALRAGREALTFGRRALGFGAQACGAGNQALTRRHCVRTDSGAGSPREQLAWGAGCDRISGYRSFSQVPPDPVATAPGSDTEVTQPRKAIIRGCVATARRGSLP
jgi:hypothetical protein